MALEKVPSESSWRLFRDRVLFPLIPSLLLALLVVSIGTWVMARNSVQRQDYEKELGSIRSDTAVQAATIAGINQRLERIESKLDRLLEHN